MTSPESVTIVVKVILGDLTSTGSGSSKKQAKHAAARAMLDKLDGRVPAQDGQTPLPPVADTANGPQAPGQPHPLHVHHVNLSLSCRQYCGSFTRAVCEARLSYAYV